MVAASRNRRTQAGDPADGEYFADTIVNARLSVGIAATVAAPAIWIIRGAFEVLNIRTDVSAAVNASAKTINIGTSASVTRFAAQVISAGAANERFTNAAASAKLADWQSTGSAQGITTVQAYWSDASGVATAARVSIDYIVIG